MTIDQYLTVEDAAQRLGVHRSFLDRRRCEGGGPKYIKMSARKVAYRATDLDAWVEAQARSSTSDNGLAA